MNKEEKVQGKRRERKADGESKTEVGGRGGWVGGRVEEEGGRVRRGRHAERRRVNAPGNNASGHPLTSSSTSLSLSSSSS